MRTLLPPPPAKIILLLLISFVFGACKKNNVLFHPNDTPESWFAVNGGQFKDGILRIRNSNGSLLLGKLDWKKLKNDTFQRREYLRIPYIYEGSDVITSPTDPEERLRFQLVLRRNQSGVFEGAIETIAYNSLLKATNGKSTRKNIDSYRLLSGQAGTMWVSDVEFKNRIKAIRNLDDFVNKDMQNQRSSDCQFYAVTEREMGDCWSEGDEVICTFTETTSYIYVCQNSQEEEDNGEDWGGGGDTGGGSGGEGQTNNEEIENLLNAMLNSSPASSLRGSTLSSENAEKRTKVYRWACVNNPTYSIISVETGVHKKVSNSNPSLQWKWESLIHSGLAMDGFVVGGTLNYSLVSATPTLGSYNAIMEVQVQLTASLTVVGIPISRSRLVPPATHAFNIND